MKNSDQPAPAGLTAGSSRIPPIPCAQPPLPKRPAKKRIWILALCLLLAASGAGVFFLLNENSRQKTLQAQYQSTLEAVDEALLYGGVSVEESCNLYQHVWYNSAYQYADDQTDAYTRPSGIFVEDCATALDNLTSSSDYQAIMAQTEEYIEQARVLLEDLDNPPGQYRQILLLAQECYDNLVTLETLAMNPSGTLSDYSSQLASADQALASSYGLFHKALSGGSLTGSAETSEEVAV